jgi:predicted permease
MPLLKGDGAVSPDGRRATVRSLLVVGQVAVTVVLLNTAGLLVKSLHQSQRAWLGFDAHKNILCVEVGVDRARGAPTSYAELAQRLQALPGVVRASYAMRLPLSGSGGGATKPVAIPGRTLSDGGVTVGIRYNVVGLGYFDVMGMRLRRGRVFDERDSAAGSRVVLISETMAARFWPGDEPIGRFIDVDKAECQIVGVVEDARINQVNESVQPFLYLPFAQSPNSSATLLVETADDARTLAAAVRREIRLAALGVTTFTTTTLQETMTRAHYPEWLGAVLSSGLAALGMALTAVGLYSVVSFSVGLRSREFALRMALGAQGGGLHALVLRQGLQLALAGTFSGLCLAAAVSYGMRGLLGGTSALDPAVMAGSAAAAAALTLFASAVPARRAARITPMSVLRHE